jgi:ABC-type polysaccharide/polyol phosphate export permease
VRSLPRLAILTNFLIAALHYVSVVYFPIDVLPIYVRPLLYLNPLTYAINFSRGILLRGDVNLAPLGALIGWCCVWSMLGYLGLRRRIQRLR